MVQPPPIFSEEKRRIQHIQIFSLWSSNNIFFKILRYASSEKTVTLKTKGIKTDTEIPMGRFPPK